LLPLLHAINVSPLLHVSVFFALPHTQTLSELNALNTLARSQVDFQWDVPDLEFSHLIPLSDLFLFEE
jgi:hypothetical protein